jgi:5'-nucleotidase
MNRKVFLHNAIQAAASLSIANTGIAQVLNAANSTKSPIIHPRQLTVLHTNDVHSRLDPFPMDGGKYQGLGGIQARALLLQTIKAEVSNTLLVDSGDMFQGTPYFNLYKGEAEILAMNKLGYDCGTMGNHDFDGGIDNFLLQMSKANFPIVVCNYDFLDTPLEDKIPPYVVVKKGKVKIGIIGVGIELQGLVPADLYGNVKYSDPVAIVNRHARYLKHSRHCDLVICLSHLGYSYDSNKISDKKLAENSFDIDVILGGHTHTFLDEPTEVKNNNGAKVLVNQVGFGGIKLGRLDFDFFHVNSNKKNLVGHSGVLVK